MGTKRVAIDAVYSIGAHCQDKIGEHRELILKLLDECRSNKSKPVRDAALETLKLLKEIHQSKKNFNQFDDTETVKNQKYIIGELRQTKKDSEEYPSFFEDQS
jgi:hypothetical protein